MKSSLPVAAAYLALTGTAMADLVDGQPECFDAIVSARIVEQIPSDVDLTTGLFAWPWFVDLKIERVSEGKAPKGRLSVLTVQHTYFNSKLGTRRWWLRRNSAGGFNMLRLNEGDHPARCAKGSAPARPYLQPINGSTLADLRQKGERRWGSSIGKPD